MSVSLEVPNLISQSIFNLYLYQATKVLAKPNTCKKIKKQTTPHKY